jgi:hypothetical protein
MKRSRNLRRNAASTRALCRALPVDGPAGFVALGTVAASAEADTWPVAVVLVAVTLGGAGTEVLGVVDAVVLPDPQPVSAASTRSGSDRTATRLPPRAIFAGRYAPPARPAWRSP